MIRQKILITGASSGLGEGMARAFAAKGRDLALCARRTERLDALKAELTQRHPGITVAVAELDVNDHDQVPKVFGELSAGLEQEGAASHRRVADRQAEQSRGRRIVAEGGNPGPASSMLKIISTELSQALTELTLEAAGPRGRVYQPHGTRPGGPIAEFAPPADDYVSGEPWQAVAPLRYFNDRAGSIYAGSNEIQRNILAKAALGL